jgi:ferritin
MLSQNIEQMLNDQINKEMYSAYLYMSMSAYLESLNLTGYANWFMIQAQEERDHALIIYQYMLRAGGRVRLAAIDQPKVDFADVAEVLEATLEHEQFITSSIYDLVDAATAERDHKTVRMLDWFVSEQVEEEENAQNNLEKYRLFGHEAKGLYMLDKEMAARVYVPSAPLTQEA